MDTSGRSPSVTSPGPAPLDIANPNFQKGHRILVRLSDASFWKLEERPTALRLK